MLLHPALDRVETVQWDRNPVRKGPKHEVGFPEPRGDTPVNLIVFPDFQEYADLELQSLTPAQAGLALMQCLVNARNLPEHGFPEITRLVRSIPAYRLTYSRFDQVGEKIEDILTGLE